MMIEKEEPLYFLEMTEPDSEVWKRLEPASTKEKCEIFCMIAIESVRDGGL